MSGSSLEHFEIPYAADGVTLVGASDYVTLRKFELTSSSSFAFWVKPTAAVTSGALYTLRNTDASGAELRLEFTTAGVGASRLDVVKVYDPGSGAATTLSKTGASIDLPTGQWSLVTLVFAPPLLSVYLGSTLKYSVAMPFFLDPPQALGQRSTYNDNAPVDLSGYMTTMEVYLGNAPASGDARALAASSGFAGSFASAVHWPRTALSSTEVGILAQMTTPQSGSGGWSGGATPTPCRSASAAPDLARGYGAWMDAVTWTVDDTVHEMVCGASGTASSFYTTDALPTGMTLSVDGHLRGSADAVAATGSVTVHAVNTAGRASAQLSLGAALAPPNITAGYLPADGGVWRSYGLSDTITLNTVNVGGTVSSYTASGTKPSWLALDASTGVLSGTVPAPGHADAAAAVGTHQFEVTATSAAGSSTSWLQITIDEYIKPDLSAGYLPAGQTMSFEKLTAITSQTITEVGGRACTYSIAPALPAGLSFATATGTISGTPTTETGQRQYYVTASLDAQPTMMSQIEVELAITAIVPTAFNAPTTMPTGANALSLTLNQPMTPVTFGADGDSAPTYYLQASTTGDCARYAAVGITIGEVSGVLSGTPRTAFSGCQMVVVARNSGGQVTQNIDVTVAADTAGGLHLGLELELSTLGAATVADLSADFDAVFVRDVAGALGIDFAQIELQDKQATTSPAGRVLVLFLLKPVSPSTTPERQLEHNLAVLSRWTHGVPADGVASSGNASKLYQGVFTRATVASVGLLAYAPDGSPRLAGDIEPAVVSGYPGGALTAYVGDALDGTFMPQQLNGTGLALSIAGAGGASLPPGVVFNASTGALTGTPSTENASMTYTVTLSNPAGSATTTFTLAILAKPPVLTPSNTGVQHWLQSGVVAIAAPTNVGGALGITWSTQGEALPSGMTINAATGVIEGSPTVAKDTANYTVVATNSGGASSVAVVINVHPHPTLVAQGTPQATPLCGPITGATPLLLETAYPIDTVGLSIGEANTAKCRWADALGAGSHTWAYATVTAANTLSCATPNVSAAVQSGLEVSFDGTEFIPVAAPPGAASYPGTATFTFYNPPTGVGNTTEMTAMLTGSTSTLGLSWSDAGFVLDPCMVNRTKIRFRDGASIVTAVLDVATSASLAGDATAATIAVDAPNVVDYQVAVDEDTNARDMMLHISLNGQQYTPAVNFTYTAVNQPLLIRTAPTAVPRRAASYVTIYGDAFLTAGAETYCDMQRWTCQPTVTGYPAITKDTLEGECSGPDVAASGCALIGGARDPACPVPAESVATTTDRAIVCQMPDLSAVSTHTHIRLKVMVGSAGTDKWSDPLQLFDMATITSIDPRSGPANGKSSFDLTGTNLDSILGGGTLSLATRENGANKLTENDGTGGTPAGSTLTAMEDAFVSTFAALSAGPNPVYFARNGADMRTGDLDTLAPLDYEFFTVFGVNSLVPASAARGTTINGANQVITIRLDGFGPNFGPCGGTLPSGGAVPAATCNTYGAPAMRPPDEIYCRFLDGEGGSVLAGGAMVTGSFMATSDETLASPGIAECEQCQCCVSCVVPTFAGDADTEQTIYVEVSTDNTTAGTSRSKVYSTATASTTVRMFSQPSATAIDHLYGPVSGGKMFNLTGLNFVDEAPTVLKCRFVALTNGAPSEVKQATVVSNTSALCVMPELNAGHYILQFSMNDYHWTPCTETLNSITVDGTSGDVCGGDGVSIYAFTAQMVDPSSVPDYVSEEITISVDGFVGIQPCYGTKFGGHTDSCNPKCRFEIAGQTGGVETTAVAPLSSSDPSFTCMTPTAANFSAAGLTLDSSEGMATVLVRLATDGEHFTEGLNLYLYPKPLITSVTPLYGPVRPEGLQITITGSNFVHQTTSSSGANFQDQISLAVRADPFTPGSANPPIENEASKTPVDVAFRTSNTLTATLSALTYGSHYIELSINGDHFPNDRAHVVVMYEQSTVPEPTAGPITRPNDVTIALAGLTASDVGQANMTCSWTYNGNETVLAATLSAAADEVMCTLPQQPEGTAGGTGQLKVGSDGEYAPSIAYDLFDMPSVDTIEPRIISKDTNAEENAARTDPALAAAGLGPSDGMYVYLNGSFLFDGTITCGFVSGNDPVPQTVAGEVYCSGDSAAAAACSAGGTSSGLCAGCSLRCEAPAALPLGETHVMVTRNLVDWSAMDDNITLTSFSVTAIDKISTADDLPLNGVGDNDPMLRLTLNGFADDARGLAVMNQGGLQCRFVPGADNGGAFDGGVWHTPAVVTANNIVSCIADNSDNTLGTPSYGFHYIQVLTQKMVDMDLRIPVNNGRQFLFYNSPSFGSHSVMDTTVFPPQQVLEAPLVSNTFTDAMYPNGAATTPPPGHSQPQQSDYGIIELSGEFPVKYTGLGLGMTGTQWACRFDNSVERDVIDWEDTDGDGVIDTIRCAFEPHAHGDVSVHFSMNPKEGQWFPLPNEPQLTLTYHGCTAGYFSPHYETACAPCPRGYYQRNENSLQCNMCGHRTYQPDEGQSDCLQCDTGDLGYTLWVPDKAGTSLSDCQCIPGDQDRRVQEAMADGTEETGIIILEANKRGFYLDTNIHGFFDSESGLPVGGHACLACPEGSVCQGRNSGWYATAACRARREELPALIAAEADGSDAKATLQAELDQNTVECGPRYSAWGPRDAELPPLPLPGYFSYYYSSLTNFTMDHARNAECTVRLEALPDVISAKQTECNGYDAASDDASACDDQLEALNVELNDLTRDCGSYLTMSFYDVLANEGETLYGVGEIAACPSAGNASLRCRGYMEGEPIDGMQCERGYSGPICRDCAAPKTYANDPRGTLMQPCPGPNCNTEYANREEAWFAKEGGCRRCQITNSGLLFVIGVVVVCALLVLCFFVSVRLAKINVKSFAPFTITLDYAQMLAIMPYLSLKWPKVVQDVFDLHELVSLDLDMFTSQAECAISFTWFEKTALYFLVPFAMAGGVLTIMMILFLLHGCGFHFGFRGSRGIKMGKKVIKRGSTASRDSVADVANAQDDFNAQPEWMHLFNMCCHAYLYMLNFSYMLITKRALMFLDCKWHPELNPARYKLDFDPRVYCTTDVEVDGERVCYDWSAFMAGDYGITLGGSDGEGSTAFGGDPACWRDMMAISMFGFLVYVVGIPALLTWKLVNNRHYAVFTKSISLQEARLRKKTSKEEPEEIVQIMLDLCQGFATYLRRYEAKEHYLYFHTTRLSTMLIKAQKHLLEERRKEMAAEGKFSLFRALAHHTRHDKLTTQIADHTNSMIEKMDEYRHMRSRYGFLLARWRPELYFWEMVYLARRFFWAVIINQLKSFPVLCATMAQLVLFVHFSLQLAFSPFERSEDNKLSFLALLTMELVLMAGVLFHQLDELHTGYDANGDRLVSRVFDGSVPRWVQPVADSVAYMICILIICTTAIESFFLAKAALERIRPWLGRKVAGPLKQCIRERIKKMGSKAKAGSKAEVAQHAKVRNLWQAGASKALASAAAAAEEAKERGAASTNVADIMAANDDDDDMPIFMGPPRGPPIGDPVRPPTSLPQRHGHDHDAHFDLDVAEDGGEGEEGAEDEAGRAYTEEELKARAKSKKLRKGKSNLTRGQSKAAAKDWAARDTNTVREASLEELALAKAQTASMSSAWVAAREGDFRFMGLWLRLGKPLDASESKGETLLMAASAAGQHIMLAFLLQIGANPNAEDAKGYTALHHAAIGGKVSSVEVLLRHNAGTDHQAHMDGFSPLHAAASAPNNARQLVELLLQYGADRHVTDRQGRTVAELAAAAGHAGALGDLLTIDTPRGAAAEKRTPQYGTQNRPSPSKQAAAASSSDAASPAKERGGGITPAPAGFGGPNAAAMSRWSRVKEAAESQSKPSMFKLLRKMGKAGGSSGVQSPPIVPQSSEPLNPEGIELQDNGSAV